MDLCLINHVHPLCSHLRQLCHFSSLETRRLLKEGLVTGSAQLNAEDQCTCVTVMFCDNYVLGIIICFLFSNKRALEIVQPIGVCFMYFFNCIYNKF